LQKGISDKKQLLEQQIHHPAASEHHQLLSDQQHYPIKKIPAS